MKKNLLTNSFIGIVCMLLLAGSFMSTTQLASARTVNAEQSNEQLLARIAELQALIAELQAVATNAQSDTEVGVMDDEVATTARLRVRSFYSAASPILAVVPAGTSGIVLNAANDQSGMRWLQVDYETGVRGWSAAPWLEVTGGGGDSSDSVNGEDVEDVVSASPASCDAFYFEPSTIARGDKTVLHWETNDAARAVVTVKSGDEELEVLANDEFPLNGSYEYTGYFSAEVDMVVYGENYSSRDACSAVLTVQGETDEPITTPTDEDVAEATEGVFDQPVTCEITVTPNEIVRGESVTMEWNSENAERMVHAVDAAGLSGEAYDIAALLNEEFPLNGSYEFTPLISSETTLTVYGENVLNTSSCSADITVTGRR